MDAAALYKKVGAFLGDHGLWPTPDNYALAYALIADEGSAAAKAVKAAKPKAEKKAPAKKPAAKPAPSKSEGKPAAKKKKES